MNISPERQKNLSFEILEHLKNQGISSNLFNRNESTNFIYKVKNIDANMIAQLNNTKSKSNTDRMKAINDLGTQICFERIENEIFSHNLAMIDSQMPLIISEMLKGAYFHSVKNIMDLVEYVAKTNPLKTNKRFYSHKIKELLYSAALGMQPTTEWEGTDKAISKYVASKIKVELLDYFTYNRNSLETHLLNNTALDILNTDQNENNILYEDNGELYIKLGLKITFV